MGASCIMTRLLSGEALPGPIEEVIIPKRYLRKLTVLRAVETLEKAV